MDAIAALYGSDSSDTEEANDVETVPTVHDASGSDGAARDDSTDDRLSASSTPSRKRPRADDSPPKWKRAFAHVDGNWPSHVRVDIAPTEAVTRLVDSVMEQARRVIGMDAVLTPMAAAADGAAMHLSLSRPFVLTYDQIEAFVEALRAALKWRSRFRATLDRPIVLVNDDATRSFLALQIGSGAHHVVSLVKCVDKCMREFGLQTYYENPIPHVSIASALGDSLRDALPQAQLDRHRPEAQDVVAQADVRVASVRVVIGNKQFHIPLR